jgi:succinate dehydrogenase/fumarate reductase flavoprotein subunit
MGERTNIRTDVLVLGAGPSGLSAASEAAATGASVVIADCIGEIGGNGAFSTGYMAFADTSLQRERGISDSPEKFLNDMLVEVERKRETFDPQFDVDVASRYAHESGSAFEFLADLGFEFGRFVPRPEQHTAERMVVMLRTAQIRDVFARQFAGLGVTVLLRRHADQLLSMAGTVTGAVLSSPTGDQTEIHASAGVVVTTGGYQASTEMRGRYQPAFDPTTPFQGLETILGEGQTMLGTVGADLVNMHMVPELVQVASRLVEECIAINESGRRFHDETGPYDRRIRGLREQPGAIAYYLCDAATADRHAQLLSELPGQARRFATLAEVARGIGAEADDLASTVSRWNAVVESSATADPDFGRVIFPDPRVGIVKPPFTVTPMIIGTDISAGGVRVSPDMEVLRADGSPIPQVFAAGDCNGFTNAAAGLGGVHLGAAVTLGRVAGRSVTA